MVAYRTGQTIGLPIGGFLAHPERQWPRAFDNDFWRTYPYDLPCFVGAGTAFFAVFWGMIFVKEVRPTGARSDAVSAFWVSRFVPSERIHIDLVYILH